MAAPLFADLVLFISFFIKAFGSFWFHSILLLTLLNLNMISKQRSTSLNSDADLRPAPLSRVNLLLQQTHSSFAANSFAEIVSTSFTYRKIEWRTLSEIEKSSYILKEPYKGSLSAARRYRSSFVGKEGMYSPLL